MAPACLVKKNDWLITDEMCSFFWFKIHWKTHTKKKSEQHKIECLVLFKLSRKCWFAFNFFKVNNGRFKFFFYVLRLFYNFFYNFTWNYFHDYISWKLKKYHRKMHSSVITSGSNLCHRLNNFVAYIIINVGY